MSNELNTAKLATLNATYAAIVSDYAPAGFEPVKFKAKADALTAISAACAAGNLAIEFDGNTAVIVDLMDSASDGDSAEFAGLGDGKGKARDWGFVTASDAWLEANPRGSEAREEYRKARRKAARMARKAAREAKEAQREAASAE